MTVLPSGGCVEMYKGMGDVGSSDVHWAGS
jgi:hypothetical protein